MITRRSESSPRWTVGRLLDWTESFFRRRGCSSPRLDAELLLAHALGCSRLDLYTAYSKLVEPDERGRFRELVERRGAHEPVAYLTGTKEFYSLSLEVNADVLIPRPETEHLVDAVLEAFPEARRSHKKSEDLVEVRILDLCTGSGNISVALAVELPRARIDAVDVSGAALAVAARNVERHSVSERVRLVEGDLLAPLPAGARYEAIVCNPPYVSAREFPELMEDVRCHEPEIALLDRRSEVNDGLGFYRELATASSPFLVTGGLLAVEVGYEQAADVRSLLEEASWVDLHTVKDYAGIDRVILARRDS